MMLNFTIFLNIFQKHFIYAKRDLDN